MERLLPEAPAAERERLPGRFRRALVELAFTVRDEIVVDRRYWILLADPMPVWSAALPDASPSAAQQTAGRFRERWSPWFTPTPRLRDAWLRPHRVQDGLAEREVPGGAAAHRGDGRRHKC